MNSKKKLIILIGLFFILMVGAFALYNNLSTNYKPDSLIVENNNSKTGIESNSSDTAANKPDNNTSSTTSNKPGNNTSNTTSNESDNDTSNSDANESNNNTSDTAHTAPDFTVFDLEGNQVNLSDFLGKPIIVNFWASWCGPCQMEMPDFDESYAVYKDKIEFLMVNMTDGSRETLEKASSFIEEKGYSFPVYYDTEYSAAITYSVSSLPTTYFIDTEGKLIAHARGAIDADTLQKGIDMIYTNE